MVVKKLDVGDLAILFNNDETCGDENKLGDAKASSGQVEVRPSLEKSLKVQGNYTFYVKVKDMAGNVSPCSTLSVSYDLDLTPPPPPTEASVNGLYFKFSFIIFYNYIF